MALGQRGELGVVLNFRFGDQVTVGRARKHRELPYCYPVLWSSCVAAGAPEDVPLFLPPLYQVLSEGDANRRDHIHGDSRWCIASYSASSLRHMIRQPWALLWS